MRELEQRAYCYLGRNPVLYMDMIEALRRGTGSVYAVREDGAVIYERNSQAYFLAAESGQSCAALCLGLQKPRQLVVHDMGSAQALKEMYHYESMMECLAAAYLAPDPPPVRGGFQLHTLEGREAEMARELFGEEVGSEDLELRLEAGAVLGAFTTANELAGVVGLYPEGGIGLLASRPEPKEKGAQRALLAGVTSWCLQQCLAPYAHVPSWEEGMIADMTRLGYSFSERALYWLAD